MDTFDTDNIPANIPAEEGNKGKETKVSPFADSPYERIAPVEEKSAPKHKKQGISVWRRFADRYLTAILAVVTILVCCTATGLITHSYWQKQMAHMSVAYNERIDVLMSQIKNSQSASTVSGENAEGLLTPAQVYEKVNQAVVEVVCEYTEIVNGEQVAGVSAGTGFLISQDGYIVSNYHIIEDALSVEINTGFGETFAAEIVGYEETSDFSLLKIDAQELPCVQLGSSENLKIGDQVVAIGYPLVSDSATQTVGYISAKDRVITTDGRTIRMLQTDAAINSGNSGGPLLNMQGQVVGITTAKSSGTSSSGAIIEGVGYAIPIDDVLRMITDLQEYGYITGTYLGVWVKDVSESAQSYGLPAGAYVEDVMDGYCAKAAGIKSQDIIVNLGGYEIKNITDLTLALRKFQAGQTVSATVYRNGQQVYLTVILDPRPMEDNEEMLEENIQAQDEFYTWEDFLFPFFGG